MYTFMTMFNLQESAPEESGATELFDQVLTFLYSLAHWAGQLVARVVEAIIGRALPLDLIDPLGFLVLLTAFIVVVQAARGLAWSVVIIGWVLILVRIVMEVLRK